MSLVTNSSTTFYGIGNHEYSVENQGSTYMLTNYGNPLQFRSAFSMTEPMGDAINTPTQASATFPHTLFQGSSDGFWVHKLYLNDHLVGTYRMCNQQFSIPIMYDRIESVSLPVSPVEGSPTECTRGHDCPEPGAFILLLVGAFVFFNRYRW